MNKFIFLSCIFIAFIANAKVIPYNHMHFYADGLNIEGGRIKKTYLNRKQIWSCIAVVLDRPIITGVNLDKITEQNTYNLKEASLIDFNETKVNLAYASIIKYYLENTRIIAKKKPEQTAKLVIQIHRNRSAAKHKKLLVDLLKPLVYYKQLIELPINKIDRYDIGHFYYAPTQTYIDFRSGSKEKEAWQQNKDVDVVLSISMISGLNPNWKSGTLVVPKTFIPYEIKSKNIDFTNQYTVDNHLFEALPSILNLQTKGLLEQITKISSENLNKTFTLKKLTLNDFKGGKILQADNMFYPKTQKFY